MGVVICTRYVKEEFNASLLPLALLLTVVYFTLRKFVPCFNTLAVYS